MIVTAAVEAEWSADIICKEGWVYPAIELADRGGQKVPEAYLHDERVLRHRLKGDLAKMFPRALPAEEAIEEDEGED